MDGVVRYEAKWSHGSDWEECTQEDYENIIRAEREGIEARALGMITDEGGLLLSGPKGFKSWRAAAVHERFLRVNLETSLREALESEGDLEKKLKKIKSLLEKADDAAR